MTVMSQPLGARCVHGRISRSRFPAVWLDSLAGTSHPAGGVETTLVLHANSTAQG